MERLRQSQVLAHNGGRLAPGAGAGDVTDFGDGSRCLSACAKARSGLGSILRDWTRACIKFENCNLVARRISLASCRSFGWMCVRVCALLAGCVVEWPGGKMKDGKRVSRMSSVDVVL